jgi:hypothetical protein
MLVEEYEKDALVRGQYIKRGEKSPASRVEHGTGVATLYDADGNFSKKVNYKEGQPIEQ